MADVIGHRESQTGLRRNGPASTNSATDLRDLSVDRLLEYRKQALCLENTLATSDYNDIADTLDNAFIRFKDDLRWQSLYNAILVELTRKQKSDTPE